MTGKSGVEKRDSSVASLPQNDEAKHTLQNDEAKHTFQNDPEQCEGEESLAKVGRQKFRLDQITAGEKDGTCQR